MNTPMNLEDLKQAWQAIDARLQKQEALHKTLLHAQKAGGLRKVLAGFAYEMIVLAALCGLGLMLVGSAGDAPESSLALNLSALVCVVYFIAALGGLFWTMQRVGNIDYAAPVVEIQQRLTALRATYVRVALLIGLPWLGLWLPFAVVALDVIAGIDIGAKIGPTYWLATLGFVMIASAALYGFYRRALRRPDSALGRIVRYSMESYSLRKAQQELDALRAFAEE